MIRTEMLPGLRVRPVQKSRLPTYSLSMFPNAESAAGEQGEAKSWNGVTSVDQSKCQNETNLIERGRRTRRNQKLEWGDQG